VTVFRYFTVYGPAGRPDMSLFCFTQWIVEERPVTIYGDGMQKRDFAFVDDIAPGTIAGLQPLGYEIINLGSDTPVVLMDTVRLIEELSGKEAKLEGIPAALPCRCLRDVGRHQQGRGAAWLAPRLPIRKASRRWSSGTSRTATGPGMWRPRCSR